MATPSCSYVDGLEAVRLIHRRAGVGDGGDRVGTGLEDELLGVAEVAPEVVELLDLRTREARSTRRRRSPA